MAGHTQITLESLQRLQSLPMPTSKNTWGRTFPVTPVRSVCQQVRTAFNEDKKVDKLDYRTASSNPLGVPVAYACSCVVTATPEHRTTSPNSTNANGITSATPAASRDCSPDGSQAAGVHVLVQLQQVGDGGLGRLKVDKTEQTIPNLHAHTGHVISNMYILKASYTDSVIEHVCG